MEAWVWIKWILYYLFKYILQAITEFILIRQYQIEDEEKVSAHAAIFGIATCLTQTLYFWSTNGIICSIAYGGAMCFGILLMRIRFEKAEARYCIGSFVMAQIHLLYWNVWNNDDILLVISAFIFTSYILYNIGNRSGSVSHNVDTMRSAAITIFCVFVFIDSLLITAALISS